MTVLVLGSSGQLAMHLRSHLPGAAFWGRNQLDLSRPAMVEDAVLSAGPSVIVNAAAFTAVDRAEVEADAAWRINAESVGAVARAAARLDARLIHVSTDYVFDGRSETPYGETDPVAPLNVYGRSKLAGELAITSLCRRHWILRTSWVFSEHGHNFVKTMLRLAREGRRLAVVDDQFGRPTYAGHLAALIQAMVTSDPGTSVLPPAVYHATGGPTTSWHRFATKALSIAESIGLLPIPVPVVESLSTADYVAGLPTRPAPRPMRSDLRPSPALSLFPVTLDWTVGLVECLRTLRASPAAPPTDSMERQA